MWGKEVSTEPGLFSLCNIFKAFSIEQRICPIIGMTMKFIVRFRIFLRLKGALLVTVLMVIRLVIPLEGRARGCHQQRGPP